jgi:type IV secretion system protein VirB11
MNSDHSALKHYLKPLEPYLSDPKVTELCMNDIHTLHIERAAQWQQVDHPALTLNWCKQLAQLIATSTQQRVNQHSPLLSAGLPSGDRIQLVLPPATTQGKLAFTIRRPSQTQLTLKDLADQGFLEHISVSETAPAYEKLKDLYKQEDWLAFLKEAVRLKLNILIGGPTGSGKTTLTKALIQEIDVTERLISIEDTPEINLSKHPNSVRLLYSKDGQGTAPVTPKQLLEASLRLRPDRILLAELRGEEAYYYCRNIHSGHAGSITSIHAGSPEMAFIQLNFLIKESDPGRQMSTRDIRKLLKSTIDLVVICSRCEGHRHISSLWWKDA